MVTRKHKISEKGETGLFFRCRAKIRHNLDEALPGNKKNER